MNDQNPFVKPGQTTINIPSTPMPAQPPAPRMEPRGGHKYHKEVAVDGRILENYHRREPIEEGKYVLITTHSERLEKIKQPEEIAQEKAEKEERERKEEARIKRENRILGGVAASLAVGFAAFVAWASKAEANLQERERVQHSNAKVKSLVNSEES